MTDQHKAIDLKDGQIYIQPAAGGEGYVGQTRQKEGKRETQHQATGRDTSCTFPVERDVPRSELNEKEAYHIGQRGTLKPEGVNATRGNDRQAYAQGHKDNLKTSEGRLDKSEKNLSEVEESLDEVEQRLDGTA